MSAQASDTSRQCDVIEADLGRDREAIIGLWQRHLPGGLPFPERRFAWEFQQNPAGVARSWLLVSKPGGRFVGTTSLIPRVMKVGDATVRAARATLMVIDKEYRHLGPAILLQRAVLRAMEEESFGAVFTVAPSQAVGVFKRLGYTDLGPYVRHAKVIDPAPHVARVTGHPALSRVLTAPVGLALRAISADTWMTLRGRTVREVETFDARFDELWAGASQHYSLTTARTSDFLRWRFDQCPWAERFVTLGLFDRSGDRLCGYAVCFIRDGHAHVFDIFGERGGGDAGALLAVVIRWARERGAGTLSLIFTGAPAFARTLRHFGVLRRHDEAHPGVLVVKTADGINGQTDPSVLASGLQILPADNF